MFRRITSFVSLVVLVWLVASLDLSYALDLNTLKIYFLQGDYKAAIAEGERLLANTTAQEPELDALYYHLGLSYLKDGNYLRAADIFEIILKELKESKFKEEAKLSLGDAYLLKGNLAQAQDCYQEILLDNSRTKLKAQLYYRLSQVGFKQGNTEMAREYLEKLKREFPQNSELAMFEDLRSSLMLALDFYYSVQVGSFSKSLNARNLTKELIQQGYPAYLEETVAGGKQIYRVKVGKFSLRQEAKKLEEKLSRQGYPTKVCP